MGFGNVTVTLTLRPIKLAFLVELFDKKAIHSAIEINSLLWGGAYNPIIPVFRRKPKNWDWPITIPGNQGDIVLGYLDAYYPDFVVPLGDCANRKWDVVHRNLLRMEDVLSKPDESSTSLYGIGVLEILNSIYADEFRFKRAEPLNIVFPRISRKHSLFLECFFGTLPRAVDDTVGQRYGSRLQIQWPAVSIRDFHLYLGPEFLFPRRISMWKIRGIRHDIFRRDPCVFLLDATKPLDVIDYWNLRAIGWDVLPVPIQSKGQDGLLKMVEDFIEQNYVPYGSNETLFHTTTLLKGRCVSEEAVSEFSHSLHLQPAAGKRSPKYLRQLWQPRVWDNWAREKDGVECCDLVADSREYDFADMADDYVSVPTVDPPMTLRNPHSGD